MLTPNALAAVMPYLGSSSDVGARVAELFELLEHARHVPRGAAVRARGPAGR
jgi:hypothetical protein